VKLITDYSDYDIYETSTGKGVLYIKKVKRGPNAAIFESADYAASIGLALMFGGSVKLTHRIKQPVITNA
jgi:hypothetical protein